MRKGKYYSKFKKEYPEPTVVYILVHPSGNLHIGIGIEKRVDLLYVANTKENMEILSNDVLTMSQMEKLISEKIKIYNKYRETQVCAVCGMEQSVIDSGLPLCDNCWEDSCWEMDQLVKRSYTPPELDIQSKDLRDLLFEF